MAERIPRSRSSKSVRLQQWAEENEHFLDQLDEILVGELQSSRSSPQKPFSRSKPTLSPGMFMKYVDNDEDGFSDVDPARLNMENLRISQAKHSNDYRSLPATTSSPIRRKSLSDYSEDTETDITEMNDDFVEADDIFGKEESGIYSNGGSGHHKADTSRVSQMLAKKKRQLQKEADLEDRELFLRYRKQHGEEVNTLKLKDLRFQPDTNLDKDALENERTVNYEYTRDDYESFEDGFDDIDHIGPEKLRLFRPPAIPHKMSMPLFPNLLKLSKQAKFRLTMDLEAAIRNEHPIFNSSNKLISKLGRMPSFHSKHDLEAFQHDDELYSMEQKKKALLEKYMEISEKQKQLRTSPRKKHLPTKHGVGLVRYLNDRSTVPSVGGNGAMKFNPRTKRWEGNDYELMRFEDDHTRNHPSLITREDFDVRGDTIKSSMKYDADNMRWVNLDEADEVENNVFFDVPDLEPNDIPRYRAPSDRGVSTFTQRTVLTVSSDKSGLSASAGDEFQLTPKLLAKFQKEEAKIRKKTHHWFGSNEHYRVDRPRTLGEEHGWEIRKMVMDNPANE